MAACVMFAACSKEDANILRKSSVSLSGDKYFNGNTATVTATLANPIDKDVNIILGSGTQVLDNTKYGLIDGSDLAFTPITIPAGQTSATSTVTVNPADYTKGRYQAQVCIGSINGAASSANADNVTITLVNGLPLASVEVSDISYDGEGTVSVKLDVPAEYEGTATLKVSADSEIPADAITFEKTLKIEKDKDSASTDFQIDIESLTESGPFDVVFEIESISDQFEASEPGSGEFEFVLPTAVPDWKIEYMGTFATDDGEVQAFNITGTEGVYYDLYRTPKDAHAEDNYLSPWFLEDRDDLDLMKYIPRYTMEFLAKYGLIYANEGVQAMKAKDPGEYDIWLIELDETANVTGRYAKLTYEVVEETVDENYERWLGQWTIGSDDDAVTITISQKVGNESFFIDGLEGVDTQKNELSVTAVYDATTGGFYIPAQTFGTWDSDYGEATDCLYGQIMMNDKVYFVDGDYPITNVFMNPDGTATMTAGSVEIEDEEAGSTLYSLVGMKYYWVVSAGAGAYSAGNTALPNTLVKVEADEEEEEAAPASVREFRTGKSFGTKVFTNKLETVGKVIL